MSRRAKSETWSLRRATHPYKTRLQTQEPKANSSTPDKPIYWAHVGFLYIVVTVTAHRPFLPSAQRGSEAGSGWGHGDPEPSGRAPGGVCPMAVGASPREAGIPSSESQLAKGFQNPEFGNLHARMDGQGQSPLHDRPKVMHSP